MNKQESEEDQKIGEIIRRKTIIAFSVFAVASVLAICLWIYLQKEPKENDQPVTLRKILKANEKVNGLFFSERHLAKEYPKEKAAREVRVNGDIGMAEEFDPDFWTLYVKGNSGKRADPYLSLNIQDIKALPKRNLIFNFKCVEGWSQISFWGGARFSDFLNKYHLGTHSGKSPDPEHPEDLFKYVGLMTPDSAYYVGIDMKSMMHPQTLLCYEMNETPLPMNQGYPLRLIIPVKYGFKSLKRIGYIYFSDTPPPDYWFERGYDYDAAL